MQQEALQRFLASVRCERFIDYLDPIGETAEEALARRIRWARMTRNDPAHADEAMFLLQHEQPLRDVLTRELSEDTGWVEEVSPGSEYDDQGAWSRDGGAHTVMHDGTLDEGETHTDLEPDLHETGIMRLEDITLDQIPTHPPAPGRTGVPVATTADAPSPPTPADADLPRGEDDEGSARGVVRVGPAQQVEPRVAGGNPGVKEVGVKSPTAGGHVGLLQPRRKVRTASPAGKRVATPTLATLSNPSMQLPRPTDAPIDEDDATPVPPNPELVRAIAKAATTGAGLEREEQPELTLPPKTTPASHDDDERSSVVIWALVGIALVVMGIGGVSLFATGPSVADGPSAELDGMKVVRPRPGP